MSTTVVATHWSDALETAGACAGALAWARTQSDVSTAWQSCERGDWMLWGWGRLAGGEPWSEARRTLVLAAGACARLALPIFEQRNPGDSRPRVAIETAEQWARGEDGATPEQVRDAAADAAAYVDAAYVDAADDADAAAYAAYAAAAAAAAAYADAAYVGAADDAAYAAYAAWRRERARVLRECAEAIRAIQPTSPWRAPK